jgi:hypothetical protein
VVAASLFFRDLAYIFVAAVVGGILARKLKQPLILGYVLGGILISPFTPGPRVSDVHSLELFAEIGVILLMFSIGIQFHSRSVAREVGRGIRRNTRHLCVSASRACVSGSARLDASRRNCHQERYFSSEHHGTGPLPARTGRATGDRAAPVRSLRRTAAEADEAFH